MPLFKKRETYNEQMLREAGLDRVRFRDPAPAPQGVEQPETPQPFDGSKMPILLYGPGGRPVYVETGPMPWDVATTATVPGIAGDTVEFVVLPEGDLIVEDETGDGDLSPLADAVEKHIPAPYRAKAARQEGDLWGVGARRIAVEEIAFPDANELLLTQNDGETEFRVDGELSDASFPAVLQRVGEAFGESYCVEASRIDGDYWEVQVNPL